MLNQGTYLQPLEVMQGKVLTRLFQDAQRSRCRLKVPPSGGKWGKFGPDWPQKVKLCL